MKLNTILVAIGSLLVSSAPMTAQTKLSASDKKFIDMAADLDMTEANLGQMAQNQASEQPVKDFGQTLNEDHSKAYGQLLDLGDKIHQQIPRGINIAKNSEYAQLHHAKAASFDRTFLTDEVREHQRALTEFRREAQHGQNADLKNYANQQIPVLEEHLRKAQDLEKSAKQRG